MIRSEQTHLKTAAGTHAGMSGKNNEDSYGVSAFVLEDDAHTPALLAVLADGIGGHNAGEVASALVVETISQQVAGSDASDPVATLNEAVRTASAQVQRMAQTESGHRGMGATVVCAWIIGKRLYTAYVGDSRIYLVRGERIFRLTQDHSWVQEALDNGLITPAQAVRHPNAHVIRRYVGSPEPPDVDFRLRLTAEENTRQAIENQGMELKSGDTLLLCSDGLTDLVKDDEILDLVRRGGPDNAIQELIALANRRGGHDNITAVMIQAPKGVFSQDALQTGRKPLAATRPLILGCLCILAGLILLGIAFLGYQYLSTHATGAGATLPAATGPSMLVHNVVFTAASVS